MGNLANFYAGKGYLREAQNWIHRARSIDHNDNALVYIEAMIEAGSGGKDLAEVARHLRAGYSVEEAVNDPELGRIRSDPASTKLVAEFRTRRGRS